MAKANVKSSFYTKEEDRAVIRKLEILTQAVDKVYPSTKGLMWRSFVQGLFVALGSTVGLAIVVALVMFILVQTKNVPVLNKIIPSQQIKEILPENK